MPAALLDLSIPVQVEFDLIDNEAVRGTGSLLRDATGQMQLDTDLAFPVLQTRTENTSIKWLTGTSGAKVFCARGRVGWEDGRQTFQVDELRWGTATPDIEYQSVVAHFDNLATLNSYRFEDGAARSADQPLTVPGLDGSPEMSLTTGAHSHAIHLSTTTTCLLEAFETHLRAFQDLITLAADRPSSRTHLTARTADDVEVEIHGRQMDISRQPALTNPVEALLRFGSSDLGTMVAEWWRIRRALRPVTQVYAGIMYQPGYVESDIISLTSIAQRMARLQLGQPRAELRTGLRTLIGNLGVDTMRATGINPTEWESHAMWARNDISHEGAPNDENGQRYVTPAESKAVRDATRIIVGLNLVSLLGLNPAARTLAAQRLEVKYGVRHGTTSIFEPPS